jgi:hypothetical protein
MQLRFQNGMICIHYLSKLVEIYTSVEAHRHGVRVDVTKRTK